MFEDPHEDADYGRLTDTARPLSEPMVVQCGRADGAAELAAAPRWEHPAPLRQPPGSRRPIREAAKALGAAGPPNLRCAAVASPDRAAAMSARVIA